MFNLCNCKLCGSKETSGDYIGVSLIKHVMVYSDDPDDDVDIEYFVKCLGCGLGVSNEYMSSAIEHWNILNGIVDEPSRT